MLMMLLPSHAGDGVVRVTWPTRCRCRVMLAMVLPSHADDDAAGVTCPRHDVDVESC
jgi:hypothetical protein